MQIYYYRLCRISNYFENLRIVSVNDLGIQFLVIPSIYVMSENFKLPVYNQVTSLITSNLNSDKVPCYLTKSTQIMAMSSPLNKWFTQTAKQTTITSIFFSVKVKILINLAPFKCKSKLEEFTSINK